MLTKLPVGFDNFAIPIAMFSLLFSIVPSLVFY